jgi:hypothetical protein
MIILITGMFPKYDNMGHPTGETEFLTSHGIDYDTDRVVITPCEPPHMLGAKFNEDFMEWVID